MAVDTRDKRFSLVSMARPFEIALPVADGDIDVKADRQHMAHLYRGIAASAPISGGIIGGGVMSQGIILSRGR